MTVVERSLGVPPGAWPRLLWNVIWIERPLPDLSAQVRTRPVAALIGLGPVRDRLLHCGECAGQIVKRAATDSHVARIKRISRQSRLCRLVLHVSAEVGTPQPAARVASRLEEEVLGRIVGAFDERRGLTGRIECDRMTEELALVAVEIGEHDRYSPAVCGARPCPLGGDAPTQILVAGLDSGGDRYQPGRPGLGRRRRRRSLSRCSRQVAWLRAIWGARVGMPNTRTGTGSIGSLACGPCAGLGCT